MESSIIPETVQLMVEVAGLCSSAPALETMRPAGMAPLRSAHKKFLAVLFAVIPWFFRHSARALATR